MMPTNQYIEMRWYNHSKTVSLLAVDEVCTKYCPILHAVTGTLPLCMKGKESVPPLTYLEFE